MLSNIDNYSIKSRNSIPVSAVGFKSSAALPAVPDLKQLDLPEKGKVFVPVSMNMTLINWQNPLYPFNRILFPTPIVTGYYKEINKKKTYCGPVSAANGIIGLSRQGFPMLNPTNNAAYLIDELAAYLKTDKQGTTSNNACKGLDAFITAKGYGYKKIEYKGFIGVDAKYKTGNIPDLEWIKSEIKPNSMVWLGLGIYKKSKSPDGKNIYQRQYGHYVLATEQGTNGISPDPNYLTIHDPYTSIKGDHYIKLEKINQGKLIHNKNDNEVPLTDNAAGFWESPYRLNYIEPDEVAIVEEATVLNM